MAQRASLSSRQLRRYSRHLLIPEVGLAGQEKLSAARVLVVGAGGLGSPALQYLAAAGVGRIGIVDDDVVDETNLQRQTIFFTTDVGEKKADVAAKRLLALNPSIAVDCVALRLNVANARELVRCYDVILDCTDRFATRYLINDATFLEKKIEVYASIFRFDGQVSVFDRARGPCYRCLYPEAPSVETAPTCAEGGVLGALAGITGAWQASEALKVILGIGQPLVGRLMLVDSLSARTREVRFDRDASCALCGDRPIILSIGGGAYDDEAQTADMTEVGAEQLDAVLRDARLLDVREPHEAVLGFVDGAVHIPASQLESRMSELDSAARYVVACRVGVKSAWALRRLHDAGFRRLVHLRGGLLSYAMSHEEFEFF